MTATLRNKRRFAAVPGETQEYPRNSQLENSSAPGITEDYIAHVSDMIERRVQSTAFCVLCPFWTNFS